MRGAAASVWLALALAFGAAAAIASPALLTEDGAIAEGWRVVGLPRGKVPVTSFRAATIAGVAALQVESVRSYGNLIYRLEPPLPVPALGWRWRLEQGNPRADLSDKSLDDIPLRVCLSFAVPLAELPFLERQKLRIAQLLAGERLPTATLCYVWDARLARGTLLNNAYTRRLRYIVLRGPGDAWGTWVDEQRDVAADFLRAFGDESATVPPVDGVGIGADSDNTQSGTLGFVAGLRMR